MSTFAKHPALAFGCVRPAADAKAATDLLWSKARGRSWSAGDVAELIRRNRVVLIAQDALGDRADSVENRALAEMLAPLAERIRVRLAQVQRSVELVDELTREAGIPVWGIKGLASRVHYPDPDLRELRDCDVAVATHNEAFHLAEILRANGFVTDRFELPWVKADRDGHLYGQYKLLGPSGVASVDIHFGTGYSTGHCGLLPVPVPAGRPGLTVLDAAANLRPMLGNSGGDVHITAKDVNDLLVALPSLTSADLATLVTDARTAGLTGHLAAIARTALRIADTTGDLRARLTGLAQLGGPLPRRYPLAAQRLPRYSRVLRTAVRSYPQARAHRCGTVRSLAVSMGALAYYSASLRLRTHPFVAAPAVPRPWRCVRLVPVSLAHDLVERGASALEEWAGDAAPGAKVRAGRATIRLRALPAGHIVEAGDSRFIPTVWFRLSRSLIAQSTTRQVATPTATEASRAVEHVGNADHA